MLNTLDNTIYAIIQLIDETEQDYNDIDKFLDVNTRPYIQVFDIDMNTYMKNARKRVISEFNAYISRKDWICFNESISSQHRELPFMDKFLIPEHN